MLLQGLNQQLLEGGDLLQVSLNVADVSRAEAGRKSDRGNKQPHHHQFANSRFTYSMCRQDISDVCATCLWGEESASRSPAGSAAPEKTRSQPPGCSAGPVRSHAIRHTHTHAQTQCHIHNAGECKASQEMIQEEHFIN